MSAVSVNCRIHLPANIILNQLIMIKILHLSQKYFTFSSVERQRSRRPVLSRTTSSARPSAVRGHSCCLGPSWPAAAAAAGLSSEAAVERSTL